MLSSKLGILQLRRFCLTSINSTSHANAFLNKVGLREVVGFGLNGQPSYQDSLTFPFPAVRFREITPNIKALKEKEKGSWKSLSIEEKKCLYRVSFCRTLAETAAPTGEWKYIIGSALILLSCAIWFHLLIIFMSRDELPVTFNKDRQIEQLKRIIALRMNPITGISSKWDYEQNKWKSEVKK